MSAKVFVGNLDFNATKEQVQSLFEQVGPVQDVFLPMDRETGRPRGFAFVEYESESDAEKAIAQFNGQELLGRTLRVNAAEDRPRRTGGFGGGGGGGERSFSGGHGFGGPGGYGGGGGGGGGFGGGKPKGSRRNIRAKKRSL